MWDAVIFNAFIVETKWSVMVSCSNLCYFFPQSQNSVQELYDKVTPLSPLKAEAVLHREDIMRYSRQLLLPELGVRGEDEDMPQVFCL